MNDEKRTAETTDMWRVDVSGYPLSVRGEPAREHLERVNRNLAVMKLALHKIAKLAERPGGVGEIARDALRVCADG